MHIFKHVMKETNEMKKGTTIVMIFSLAVFLLSACIVLFQNRQEQQSADLFKELSDRLNVMVSAEAEAAQPAQPEQQPQLTSGLWPETDDPVLLAYRQQAVVQPDFVGWLRIDGTMVDYPVMRSPDEAERYLHRDFEGKYSRAGTPFMLPISDPAIPNENIIIYAHHMKDGSMFGTLPKYETKDAYDAQPYITFDTLYERGTYKIIAVFRTSIGAPDEFPYYEYEWLDDEAAFNRFINGVMANRLYDTGETAVYGDELLSLSTCDYHEPNGRLVVVAKRIQETEENGNV